MRGFTDIVVKDLELGLAQVLCLDVRGLRFSVPRNGHPLTDDWIAGLVVEFDGLQVGQGDWLNPKSREIVHSFYFIELGVYIDFTEDPAPLCRPGSAVEPVRPDQDTSLPIGLEDEWERGRTPPAGI